MCSGGVFIAAMSTAKQIAIPTVAAVLAATLFEFVVRPWLRKNQSSNQP